MKICESMQDWRDRHWLCGLPLISEAILLYAIFGQVSNFDRSFLFLLKSNIKIPPFHYQNKNKNPSSFFFFSIFSMIHLLQRICKLIPGGSHCWVKFKWTIILRCSKPILKKCNFWTSVLGFSAQALFSSQNFLGKSTVVFSFLFDKYCPIIE